MMLRLWLLIGPLTIRVNLTAYSHKARRRWPQDGLWSRTSCLSSNPAPSLSLGKIRQQTCACVWCVELIPRSQYTTALQGQRQGKASKPTATHDARAQRPSRPAGSWITLPGGREPGSVMGLWCF
ncbi:hypothetical protein CCHR01_15682 [Colletotrichum chrysophilum]|uniref:Secreted protein n=1 Tax=Colletotrichum chrysophilum TaxID=1836956 RepID=A0AAD9EEA5_9PEZI|nr:hypothetical protein CCHR01_15682 [Colletotrichum chrysophilum]